MKTFALKTKLTAAGFTMIELLIVMAIVAILALMAIPMLTGNTPRKQILESMPLAEIAKAGVANYYRASTEGSLPSSNDVAGVPEAAKLSGNYVSSVEINNGAVNMTFGNNAHAKIKGKHLSFRPAVTKGERGIPIAWVCGIQAPPAGKDLGGTNITDVPPDTLPIGPPPYDCR